MPPLEPTIADIPARSTSYTGLAFRPGDRELWASETRRDGPDSLLVSALGETGKFEKSDRIDLPGHPLPCGIAFSPTGELAYVAFSRNNTLAIIDTKARALVHEIPVGIAPFGVAVSTKLGKIFVSNRGGRVPAANDVTGPSSGSAVLTDPVTGIHGQRHHQRHRRQDQHRAACARRPRAFSPRPESRRIAPRRHQQPLRLPTLLDTRKLQRTDIKIPTYPESAIGSVPNGAVFSPDGKRVYVACGGNNAMAVVSSRTASSGTWKAPFPPAGSLPPSRLDSAGSLRVLNIKGTGNTARPQGNFNSRQFEGSLLKIPAPLPVQIASGTREVIAANSPKFEDSRRHREPYVSRHRARLLHRQRKPHLRPGLRRPPQGQQRSSTGYVWPRHHAQPSRPCREVRHSRQLLHRRAISFDGHQWLMQAFVSDYVERAFAASPRGYAWNMSDALTVSPVGMFWQSATKPLNVRIYGEFTLPARWDPRTQSAIDIDEKQELTWTQYWDAYKQNKWQTAVGSRSGVPALERFMDVRYPNDSTSIPDQIRADELIRELHGFEKTGNLPHLLVITLNSDHTNGTRPGSPTPKAMVADDDLALGHIVEAVSQKQVLGEEPDPRRRR